MIGKFLQTRRANRALADAMRQRDLADMQRAIAQGAHLGKVSDTFEEPMMHFQTLYNVQGALQLAVEHRLPLEAFRLLLDAGAPVPTSADGRPHLEALFDQDALAHWPHARALVDMLNERAGQPSIEAPPGPPAGRRPGFHS